MEEDSLLKTDDLEIKWGAHKAGEVRDTIRAQKTGKTLSVLISGKMKVRFPDLDQEYILERMGDYVVFDVGVFHTSEMVEDSTIITIRWPSIPNDVITK